MTPRDRDELRLLVPRSVATALTRRRFLGLSAMGATAIGLGLPGCGTSDDDDTSAGGGDGELEGTLNIYTWAEYSDPANVDAFTSDNGVDVKLDIFDSNEQAIAKLELAGDSSGYDIVVPTGSYIPQLVDKGLLRELDKSKIPNFDNIDPTYLDQPWDPGNKYSAVKDWGSTGYVYDSSVIDEELSDWADFIRVAALDGVSGQVSVLDGTDVIGIALWREGIDWNTTDPADLDLAEQILREELAPHIKAFDSYPSTAMLEGSYVLAQDWNGGARTIVIEDPERYRWVLGAPKTDLWFDTWTILADAQHPEAAYAFINFMLEPEASAKEIEYHGYNTAVLGTEEFLGDLEGREIIFFTDEEEARFDPGVVNEAQDRHVAIIDALKAAAGQ